MQYNKREGEFWRGSVPNSALSLLDRKAKSEKSDEDTVSFQITLKIVYVNLLDYLSMKLTESVLKSMKKPQ